jgi:hypothetical protein
VPDIATHPVRAAKPAAGVALPRRSSSGQGDTGCADAVSPIITRNVPAADHGSVISAVDARRAEK